jgi:hypothetical protein
MPNIAAAIAQLTHLAPQSTEPIIQNEELYESQNHSGRELSAL